MIDWLTALILVPDPVREIDWRRIAGYTLFCEPGGEITKVQDKWLPIKGSFDSAIRVRIGTAGLWVSGNPTKFLSGQNVDGLDDVGRLLTSILGRVTAALSLPSSITPGDARLTRIDITNSLQMGSIERVREALRIASLTARARNQGRSHTAYQTVYLGQHSRRHSIKLYAKADELAQHPPLGLPESIHAAVHSQAAGLLRIELTLRKMELEEVNAATLDVWQDTFLPLQLWQRYWGRVEISQGADLLDDELTNLPRRLRGTYELWRRGCDCAELLSRSTFYRHRRDLWRHSRGGIDIGVMRPTVIGTELARENLGAYLHQLPVWHAGGELADWLQETVA